MNTTAKCEQIGKKYKQEWIFRHFDFTFESSQAYAIVGNNGSGKSTLMQMLAGYAAPSKGKVIYEIDQKTVSNDTLFRYLAWCSPALELLLEMTLYEFLTFHFQFKPLVKDFIISQLIDALDLKKAVHKPLIHFSSGMLQRVKLAICFYADVPILLLDEPTTNLDTKGIDWYLEQMEQPHILKKLVVVSSNQPHEYGFCNQVIDIGSYKSV